jgi:predicted PurR-regulated permease PerM
MAKNSRTDLQRVLLPLGVAGLLVALVLLLWAIADVLLMLFLGILLAIVLRSAADLLQHYTPIPHPWALGLVVTLSLVVFGVGTLLLIPEIATQLEELFEQIQVANNQLQIFLNQSPLGNTLPPGFLDIPDQLPGVGNLLGRLTTTFTEGFGIIANILFIGFTGLFLAISPHRYRQGLVRLVPPSGRHRTVDVLKKLNHGLRSWLVGRVVSMVLIAIIITIGLKVLGIPLALVLGIITGLLEFIPVVGPLLSAVPAILIGFTLGPMPAVYVAVFYLVVQQLEGNIITPIVQLKTADLPPVVTLTAVLAMGLLFGPLGVLVATPLAVVVMILVQELYIHDLLER